MKTFNLFLCCLLSICPTIQALEIRGQTSFVAVPTPIKFVNYASKAWQSGARYNFTISLPLDADASLGMLSLEQIQGAESAFYRREVKPKAYYGNHKRTGNIDEIPITAHYGNHGRLINVKFKQPIKPGQTITVTFNVLRNPPSGLYMWAVNAIPAGPSPISQPVGVVRMMVYQPNRLR